MTQPGPRIIPPDEATAAHQIRCWECDQPSSTPTCDRCLGYQAWASSSRGDNQPSSDSRLRRKLGQARADLVALPGLLEELARCKTEHDPGAKRSGKITGSPSPVRLDVLHLTDERRKPGWEGEDPRLHSLGDRYGAAALLESWTRVVFEEMPEDERPQLADRATVRTESAVLLEVWDWIGGQQWAEELADDVTALAGKVRTSSRIRREYRPRCRYCRDNVAPVDDAHRETTWEACAYGLCKGCGRTFAPGPELAALGQVQKPMSLKEASEVTGIPVSTLHRWADQGAITPDPGAAGKRSRLFDLAAVRAVATRVYSRAAE